MSRRPTLIEIDLSKATIKGGPGIRLGQMYLYLKDDRLLCGDFIRTYDPGWAEHGNLKFDSGEAGEEDFSPSPYHRLWRITGMRNIMTQAIMFNKLRF